MDSALILAAALTLFGASMILLSHLMTPKKRKQPRDSRGRFMKFPD